MNFTPIKNVLNEVLAQKKMRGKFEASEVCTVCEKLFLSEDTKLEGNFKVKFVKNGVIHVSTISSSISSQMRLLENEVLDLLKQRFPSIKKILYKIEKFENILPY